MVGMQKGSLEYRRATWAMLAFGLAIFNALYATQALLPTLTTELAVSPSTAALTVSAATGALALCVVPASILSEKYGRGRVLVVSALGATALGLALPLAQTAGQLIALRAAQGALIAGTPAVAMTWLSEELDPRDLPGAMGLYIAGNSIGGLSGRLIPAGLLEVTSWRWAMFGSALVAFTLAALAAWGAMAGAALSGSVPLGDDGLHKPDWLKDSFRDVREDAAEAEPFVIVPVVRAASVVRDAVILTPGYGRTPHGRVVHHFGAFSDPDGERMVTVALTRARRRLHLVSALRAADLDEDRLDGGALWFLRLLEAYLGDDAADPVGTVGDPLLADLRDRLEEHGARVLPRYAGVMDLAVLDPRADEAPRPLALAGDGGEVYRALTVRQRSRTLPEGLEARGWEPRTLWAIDVFADPESVARGLADRLGVEPADETDEADDDAR